MLEVTRLKGLIVGGFAICTVMSGSGAKMEDVDIWSNGEVAGSALRGCAVPLIVIGLRRTNVNITTVSVSAAPQNSTASPGSPSLR